MNKNIKSNKRDNVLNKTTLGSNLCIYSLKKFNLMYEFLYWKFPYLSSIILTFLKWNLLVLNHNYKIKFCPYVF